MTKHSGITSLAGIALLLGLGDGDDILAKSEDLDLGQTGPLAAIVAHRAFFFCGQVGVGGLADGDLAASRGAQEIVGGAAAV